jgi:hypothetical protein
MMVRLLPYLLTCGLFVLTLAAWIKMIRVRPAPSPLTWAALALVSANAALGAGTYLWYGFRPTHLPPWKDPGTLTLAILFFTAPIGMIVGLIAAARRAPPWLVILWRLRRCHCSLLAFWKVFQCESRSAL